MKLYSLLKSINCRVFGTTVLDITGLYHSDTSVKENGLFFCLRGTRADGKDFVLSAIKNGAVAIVTEQEIAGINSVTQIIVKNARETMSLLACRFYGNPAEKLKIIGVTGTNGKTTITNMIYHTVTALGKKCALIGTNGIYFGNTHFDTGMTTPDPIDLQRYFSIMVKNKVEYVAMEVSAHAIALSKTDGFRFEQVIFTNLTPDHLDFFKDMESYFSAKAKLFSKKYTSLAIINRDDPYGERLLGSINLNAIGYAINEKAELTAENIVVSGRGQSFYVGENKVEIRMLGKFNVYNALAAIASLENLGFSRQDIIPALGSMEAVEGRFNFEKIGKKTFIVDYAHSPDGLKNVLLTCREIAGESKVLCVFGCGGNRDSEKRPIMGELSTRLADFTIITSDNPRFEKREAIARDIESGAVGKNYKIVLDRKEAIREAYELANDGDIILVAGKGAENYIDENGVKIPYSDKAEISKLRR